MAIENPKAKHLSQTTQYRRPHQKYGTGTLINKDKNPPQNRVSKPRKRGIRKKIGKPTYNNDKKPSPFDGKIDIYVDMDSGEELVKNKTKLEENGPRFISARSK